MMDKGRQGNGDEETRAGRCINRGETVSSEIDEFRFEPWTAFFALLFPYFKIIKDRLMSSPFRKYAFSLIGACLSSYCEFLSIA